MVAVVIWHATAMHAVIHGIRIGEAVSNIVAMAESHDRWGRDKAKGGENGDHHRRAKATPGTQLLQHRGSVWL
jgi:hypothetical protein